MSNSLLKRSLQIVEESLETNKAENAAKSKKKKTNAAQPRSSTFDLIPENQRLIMVSKVGKTQQKKKTNELKQRQKVTVKQVQNKINRSKDKISDNVRKILLLDSAVKMSDEAAETLIRRARTGRYVIPEPKPAADTTTAFTEEDFLKFEREYFIN